MPFAFSLQANGADDNIEQMFTYPLRPCMMEKEKKARQGKGRQLNMASILMGLTREDKEPGNRKGSLGSEDHPILLWEADEDAVLSSIRRDLSIGEGIGVEPIEIEETIEAMSAFSDEVRCDMPDRADFAQGRRAQALRAREHERKLQRAMEALSEVAAGTSLGERLSCRRLDESAYRVERDARIREIAARRRADGAGDPEKAHDDPLATYHMPDDAPWMFPEQGEVGTRAPHSESAARREAPPPDPAQLAIPDDDASDIADWPACRPGAQR